MAFSSALVFGRKASVRAPALHKRKPPAPPPKLNTLFLSLHTLYLFTLSLFLYYVLYVFDRAPNFLRPITLVGVFHACSSRQSSMSSMLPPFVV